jgi:uncharacterized protein (TIGR02145 family)
LESYLDITVNCTSNGWTGTDVGGKMKEIGTVHWPYPNTGATNSSEFSALPGGQRNPDGTYASFPNYVVYWSATENTSSKAWYHYLFNNSSQINKFDADKPFGFSIRCLKD